MNLFTQFKKLLPEHPLLVGDVVAVGNDIATVQLPGGSQVTARGDVVTGDRVFLRDRVIEGKAPNLPYVEYDI